MNCDCLHCRNSLTATVLCSYVADLEKGVLAITHVLTLMSPVPFLSLDTLLPQTVYVITRAFSRSGSVRGFAPFRALGE